MRQECGLALGNQSNDDVARVAHLLQAPVRAEVRAWLPERPADAWRDALEWERQPQWMSDAASVRVMSSRREGVGVRLAVKTRVLGVPVFTEILEVVVWEPPHRVALAHRGFVQGMGEWTFRERAEGTWVRWTETLRLPVPILGAAVLAVYRPILVRLMRRSLEALRLYVHTASRDDVGPSHHPSVTDQ
jgi:hypothetical protein